MPTISGVLLPVIEVQATKCPTICTLLDGQAVNYLAMQQHADCGALGGLDLMAPRSFGF
jgi:hypothetical protein